MEKYTNNITHINATQYFLDNPKCLDALEELCKKAYHYEPKNKNMNTEETAKLVAKKFGFIEGTQKFNVVVKIFCEGAEYGYKIKEDEVKKV